MAYIVEIIGGPPPADFPEHLQGRIEGSLSEAVEIAKRVDTMLGDYKPRHAVRITDDNGATVWPEPSNA